MPQLIQPTYPPNCKVVFCGDAPNAEEAHQGQFWTGRVGELLRKVIWASGLSYDSIGRTAVCKRVLEQAQVGQQFAELYDTSREGRKKVVQPSAELLGWYESLHTELETCKPNIVVACGPEALKALVGIDSIVKSRGSILPCRLAPGRKVIPIIHPRDILGGAQWQELYITSEIIARKVVGHQDSPKIQYDDWEEHLAPTREAFEQFVRSIDGPFSLDIETRAGSVACVGLCYHSNGLDRAMCIPLQTTRGPYWEDVEDEWAWWRSLQWLCQRQPLIGHNVFYDLDWLLDYGITPLEVHDTMLLFHRYYAELPKSLAFCNMWFTDIPYYKDDGKTWGYKQPDEKLWSYNIKDVVSTHRVWRALYDLRKQFPRQWSLYQDYTRKTMPLAFEMQALGLDANADGVQTARDILSAEMDKIRGRLEILSDGELAVRKGNKKITDQQAASYLYGKLGLKPIYNRKTKALTADEDALVELLIRNPEMEVLKALNAERKFGKALNSYINIAWKDVDAVTPEGRADMVAL